MDGKVSTVHVYIYMKMEICLGPVQTTQKLSEYIKKYYLKVAKSLLLFDKECSLGTNDAKVICNII